LATLITLLLFCCFLPSLLLRTRACCFGDGKMRMNGKMSASRGKHTVRPCRRSPDKIVKFFTRRGQRTASGSTQGHAAELSGTDQPKELNASYGLDALNVRPFNLINSVTATRLSQSMSHAAAWLAHSQKMQTFINTK
jgi:hypothetical protein